MEQQRPPPCFDVDSMCSPSENVTIHFSCHGNPELYSFLFKTNCYVKQTLNEQVFRYFLSQKPLKGRADTLGNCQRPVSPLGVAQHMHKIPYL